MRTRQLHELTADELLAVLEKRQDDFLTCADAESRADAAHKSLEAAVYKAVRSSEKISIEDAKAYVRCDETVQTSLGDLLDRQRDAAKARAAVERAKLGIDLWRSEAATRRRV